MQYETNEEGQVSPSSPPVVQVLRVRFVGGPKDGLETDANIKFMRLDGLDPFTGLSITTGGAVYAYTGENTFTYQGDL